MLKKVFQVLAALLLVAVILACLGIFIAPRFGWHLDIVYSGSMEPTIKVGSLAIIKPVESAAVSEGDIITYAPITDTSIKVTHSVVEVIDGEHGLMFRTKGDANEDPDAYAVPAENVVGRVWMSVPYAGYAMDFVKKPLGFGLLIGLPAILIIGMELKNIFLSVRDLRRKGRVKRVRRVRKAPIKQALK